MKKYTDKESFTTDGLSYVKVQENNNQERQMYAMTTRQFHSKMIDASLSKFLRYSPDNNLQSGSLWQGQIKVIS